ncbi:DBF4-type zinc finger-containing protein 2 [Scleropages formosus]|uniref:DBF4-type zinc finger-containing protein 2 n=1 Tax=Scleropages formosus TaxID=113540 RepID=UPI0010FAA54B|nr:DBF4-type zinc finger-containing protein 2 [Scleropages formosus]XP_018620792.2 DBF4-type zinc finger-containing protein 2 [Scleropages formosus]XP_018620800.2 DBF4-type zinc finger-containing protein 2 [Scleropages formosus]XP_018620807.2 DBF4-type zinc finger-containing protein 2 [Scleropages formosus]XP_018620815.2 DBF4-type zinc finger-containing protein 2 [Scleropages formosus]XP_018620823.2 DBF4-type zinc finger-containing protein 2 [Scleropages formosus]XP_018620830.2 DBF4-type zinc
MPAEEHSAPSAQADAEHGQTETPSKLEPLSRSSVTDQPIPGPSSTPQRQGFCSCCQVIYSSVEQHILSTRHRQVVSGARTHTTSGSLMERFLQDVIQHHPHRYNDTRPTHADLPSLSTPLVPKEVLSDVCCTEEDDGDTVGTREEMLGSDEGSCLSVFVEDVGASRREGLQECRTGGAQDVRSKTSSSSDGNRVKMRKNQTFEDTDSPMQGLFHRTSGRYASAQVHPCSPQGSSSGKQLRPPVQLHRKAHRKTDRRRNKTDSDSSSSMALKDTNTRPAAPLVRPSLQDVHRVQAPSSKLSETVADVIEEVIEKYCYGPISAERQDDEDSFHLSLGSITKPYFSDSGPSLQLDIPDQDLSEGPKPAVKDLGCLMEVHLNLEDQKYRSQLHSALNLTPGLEENCTVGAVRAREEAHEEVLPALPHVPPSFVGKTWAQVMHEDDLKIEAMVREFREGRFRCYFESESLAAFGKRSDKRKRKGGLAQKEEWEGEHVLPLTDHPEDDSVCGRVLRKSAGRRTWRLASRCQVVKVSHSTQTTLLTSPVVRPRALEKSSFPAEDFEPQQDPAMERTPDMKTRLCPLKLPEAYWKIMTPLQPKTVVYVLSSPDSVEVPSKPITIRKAGRKRKSSDDSVLKYKYKKTPLKYYDPQSNRILKTPPKGVAVGKPSSLHHVRQLFRSLSPDINKEKQFVEQRDTRSSSKRRGSSIAELCASTSGSCLESAGASELGSSVSSRKVLFSRSSISSSGCFLPGSRTPTPSCTDSTKRTLPAESSDVVRTRARRSPKIGRQGAQVECLKEKGPSPPYKPRKMPARLTAKRGRHRLEFPAKSCGRGRLPKTMDHGKDSTQGFLPKVKAKSTPPHQAVSQKSPVRMSPKSKSSVRASSQPPSLQKRRSGAPTRSSNRHAPASLVTHKLRKRVKR